MSGNFNDLLSKLDSVSKDESVPQWAILLIDCFKSFMTVFNENQMLKDEISELRNDVRTLQVKNDDYEQRNRNECLVIHGIPEPGDGEAREDTDVVVCNQVNELLNVDLGVDDLKRSHRLGVKKLQGNTQRTTRSTASKSSRPIIFRLQSFRKRQEIFNSKKQLKGTGITITESLTRTRYDIYRAAVAKFSKENVWTSEGRIMVKLGTQKHSITTNDELSNLRSPDEL